MSDTTSTVPIYTCRPTSRMEAIFLEAVERDHYESDDWRHPESQPGAYVEHNFIITDADEEEFATFSDEVMAGCCMAMIEQARAHVSETDRRTRMETIRKIHGFRRVYTVARF